MASRHPGSHPAGATGSGAKIGRPMNKLVLFDIDGTILLTAGAGRRAIVAALTEEIEGTEAFDRIRFDGKTDPQIVAELLEAAGDRGPLAQARLDALCERYVRHL